MYKKLYIFCGFKQLLKCTATSVSYDFLGK